MKNNLKKIREEYNMSLMEFAVFLGVHYNTYRSWETETGQPTLSVAFDVAKKLNMKIEDIWFK